MQNIREYLVSSAFFQSSLFITQENDDNTHIYFELSYRPPKKIYIKLMATSQVNKTCDVIYEGVYDQFDQKIRAPAFYPPDATELIKECLGIMTLNRRAKNTHIMGIPCSLHEKKMREKWFAEVLLETFCTIFYNAKVNNIHMSY